MRITDHRSVRPSELEPGMVFTSTVILQIGYRRDGEGKPMYRVYAGAYPPQVSEGIPQGSPTLPDQAEDIAKHLFPVVGWADLKVDTY